MTCRSFTTNLRTNSMYTVKLQESIDVITNISQVPEFKLNLNWHTLLRQMRKMTYIVPFSQPDHCELSI